MSAIIKKRTYRLRPQNDFLHTKVSPALLVISALSALIYFFVLAFLFPKGQIVLWSLLIAGEVFHLWQTLTYIHTVWKTDYQMPSDPNFKPAVDVFITVAGEPIEVIEETAKAAISMDYPNYKVYILNDGYVAKKDNWKEVLKLANKLEVTCITRQTPGGAKAGNINNGLENSSAPFIAVFDADHVPHRNFLSKTIGYLSDSTVGFVQTPQYYKNYGLNEVTRGAWEQQELFFGPICRGKNRLNSTFMCGTNMVIRRSALVAAGGMYEKNIAEDFLTSLFIHEQGWKSVYVPEVLAEGLAPEDFISYYKQQFRWCRGSLEVLFKHNPIFNKNLSWAQKTQYLASSSYYLSGFIVLINVILPLIFFFTGLLPVNISTMALAAVFLPYIFLNVLTLRISSNFAYTFRALSYSMSSFSLQIKGIWAVLTGQQTGFSVTSKRKLNGNFLAQVVPHMAYIILLMVGVEIAVLREGLSAAVVTNLSWALFNTAVFLPFISAAIPSLNLFESKEKERLPQIDKNLGSITSAKVITVLDNERNINMDA